MRLGRALELNETELLKLAGIAVPLHATSLDVMLRTECGLPPEAIERVKQTIDAVLDEYNQPPPDRGTNAQEGGRETMSHQHITQSPRATWPSSCARSCRCAPLTLSESYMLAERQASQALDLVGITEPGPTVGWLLDLPRVEVRLAPRHRMDRPWCGGRIELPTMTMWPPEPPRGK